MNVTTNSANTCILPTPVTMAIALKAFYEKVMDWSDSIFHLSLLRKHLMKGQTTFCHSSGNIL